MKSKLIVYPTDFSYCSKNAMPYVIAMGKALKSKIRIVHSMEMASLGSAKNNPIAVALLEKITLIEEEAERKLIKLKNEIQICGLECEYDIIQGRTLFLKEYMEDINPLMIVMGTIGKSGLENKIFGSQTSKIIRNTKSIVLVVPEKAKFNNLSQIVFATDYHTKDKTCIEFITKITKYYEASLEVIHICEPHENLKEKQNFLLKLKDEISQVFSNQKLYLKLLNADDPEDKLLEFLENANPDMLCLITRKRNFIERLFDKSMAKKMVNHTNTPVLVFS
ncbi:MAG: universal stress protein [Algibacter sp.]|uniref:universal stress protein n=1 Tax=Algibacter sp. TaxID=1872428 RepID=UPI00262B27DE|nr:universal stress protein [Algibacter sp.]MDG1729492.1 universal stress protein [Algibacter sp.]MDG2178678.1 universal stress protein [Algibacter sp.]